MNQGGGGNSDDDDPSSPSDKDSGNEDSDNPSESWHSIQTKMTLSQKMNAATKGSGQAAHQQARMKTTQKTNRPKYPARRRNNQGRSSLERS